MFYDEIIDNLDIMRLWLDDEFSNARVILLEKIYLRSISIFLLINEFSLILLYHYATDNFSKSNMQTLFFATQQDMIDN